MDEQFPCQKTPTARLCTNLRGYPYSGAMGAAVNSVHTAWKDSFWVKTLGFPTLEGLNSVGAFLGIHPAQLRAETIFWSTPQNELTKEGMKTISHYLVSDTFAIALVKTTVKGGFMFTLLRDPFQTELKEIIF